MKKEPFFVLDSGQNWEIIRHEVKWIWLLPQITYVFRADYLPNGKILFFLHADTFLPPRGLHMIEAAMAREVTVAGSFALRFDCQHPLLRLYARFSRINHILFTYGDQGLFMTRRAFLRVGGFKEIPLMEDIEIQQKLRKIGRFEKIDRPVITSARRFLSEGIIKQELLNIGLVLLYYAKVSPRTLQHYYTNRLSKHRDNLSD